MANHLERFLGDSQVGKYLYALSLLLTGRFMVLVEQSYNMDEIEAGEQHTRVKTTPPVRYDEGGEWS